MTPLDAAMPEILSCYVPRFVEYRSEEIARLVSLRAEFDEAGFPAHVELGASRGAFLEGIARAAAPDATLGLEWRRKFARWGTERLAKRGLDNARLLHADAKLAVPILFAPETVRAFYILFPDPWWKKRHVARRLLDPLFLRILARRLVPGGRIYLKSDVFDYLYRVRSCVTASAAVEPLPPECWPDETAWTLSTRERKCMRSAIPFGRGYYRRREDFESSLPVEPERAEDFPVADVDGVAEIKGPPPADRESWRKRR